MSGYLLFGANTSGSQIQRMQSLNDLTVSGKSVLQCTSLVASEDVSCNTAVIGDLTVSGNINFSGTLTVCNIFCPNDLFITAVSNIVMEASNLIRTTGQDVVLVGSNSIAAISGAALIELDSASGGATIESTDLTVTTAATTSISSGGTLDISSSGASGSIIRLKTEPGLNASGSISIATTAGFPPINNDDIAIDSANDLTMRSASDTRITALAGDINTSSADVSIETSGTGGIKLGNSSTGNVNLELEDGDLRLGTLGGSNVHLAFLGVTGGPTITGIGTWTGAGVGIDLIGETDTTGVIGFTGLPPGGITKGDGFIIEFTRAYETTVLHGWLSAIFGPNPSVLAAEQAAAGIALSGYLTNSNSLSIEFIFTRDVLAADIATFTGSVYTGEMDFSYFVVDSIVSP